MFALSYKDLKGVDPTICQHTISMKEARQKPYTYNDTFAKETKEEIDKLKEAEFLGGVTYKKCAYHESSTEGHFKYLKLTKI